MLIVGNSSKMILPNTSKPYEIDITNISLFLCLIYRNFHRWDHISASVDDRTKAERGEEPLSEDYGK